MHKILFCSFDVVPAPKGASTHILQSTRALAREFPSVTLFTIRAPGQPGNENIDGVRVIRAPLDEANFLRRVRAFRRHLYTLLKQERFDVVHFRDIWSGIAVLDAQSESHRYQCIYEVNGLPSFELAYHYPRLSSERDFVRRLRAQELHCMLMARQIITPSPVTRDYIRKMGLAPSKITVIPNGVDPERFLPPRQEPRDDPPRLLYVGTLAPWQGAPTLLAALKKVVRTRPVFCTFAGRGKKKWLKSLLVQATEMKLLACVEFLGQVAPARIPGMIAASSLCLAPLERTRRNTRQGCCPIKILEYMACARPFIVSDLPVATCLLPENSGLFLVRPGKPNDLAAAILRILDEVPGEALRLAERMREHVVSNYSWDKSNRAVVELHRSFLTPD